MKKICKRLLCLVLVLFMLAGVFTASAMTATSSESAIDAKEFASPAMEYRPGVRWWLPGGDITEEEMLRELGLLMDNGFGYAEINAFGVDNFGYENTAPHDQYATDAYYDAIEATVAKAAANDFTIDLNMGSGWNANDASVEIEDSLGNMAIGRKTLTVSAEQVGVSMELAVPEMELSPAYATTSVTTGGTATALGVVVARIAAVAEGHITKATLNGEAADDQLLLDADTVEIIDVLESGAATVTWTPAEAGDYAFITLYSYPTGCRPIDSVNVDDGFVIDHMDYDIVTAYMENWMGEGTRINDMLEKYPGTIRALFNDSYEFYGDTYFNTAVYENARDAENNLLGYDFSPYLVNVYKTKHMWPEYQIRLGWVDASNDTFVAMADENGDKDADVANRIAYDYSLLVNQLFQEGMKGFYDVSEKYGVQYRQQAYNTPTDTIGSARYIHIPEDEQQNENNLKRTASGSHLYNRPLTTAEQFTLGNVPFTNDMDKLKDGIDLMATSGVNNFLYHGMNYRYFGTEEMQADHVYGETGSSAFFSIGVNVTEANSLFPFYQEINAYASRVNYLMQQGAPSMDVALYMDFNGSISNTTGAGKALNDDGYAWDAINDDAIVNMASYDAEAGLIRIEGSEVTYKAIVVQSSSLPVSTMEALQTLVNEGATVVFYGTTPSRHPGYADGNYAAADAEVAAIAAAMLEKGAKTASDADTLADALGEYDVISYEKNEDLRFIRRALEGGAELAYIRNTASTQNTVTITVPKEYVNCYWLNQTTGEIHVADVQDGRITITLGDTAAVALLCQPSGMQYAYYELSAGVPQGIDEIYLGTAEAAGSVALNDFTLTVTADNIATGGAYGAETTVTYTEDVLGNWATNDYHNGDLKFVNATGYYTTTVEVEKDEQTRYVLNLGEVNTVARVTVNGVAAGTVLYAPYKLDITDYLTQGENTVEIAVTPRTYNRYIGFGLAYKAAAAAGDENGMKLYQYYQNVAESSYSWPAGFVSNYVATGLVGPVSIDLYEEESTVVALTGESAVTVEQNELNYTVTAENAENLATADVTVELSGNLDGVDVEAGEGWFVLSSSYEDGVLNAIVCNNAGVTSEEAVEVLRVTVTTTGKTGEVKAVLTGATLSAYSGSESETFVNVTLGNTEVTTKIEYSVYDVNRDGVVDQLDITRAQRAYGAEAGDDNWNALADVNGDGSVDINDLILILNNYTK